MMRRSHTFLLAIALGWIGSIAHADTVVLDAGDIQVTQSEIEQALAALPPEKQSEMRSNSKRLLDLVLQLYVEDRIEQEAQGKELASNPTVARLLQQARAQILRRALLSDYVAKQEFPDFEQLAKERYQANKANYIRPERIMIAQIFIKKDPGNPAEARQQAEALLEQLQRGASFEELAKEHSEGPNASRGGEFEDWIPRQATWDNPLLKDVFALKEIGDLTAVLESEQGYHILQLKDRQESRQLPYEQVRGKIMDKLSKEYAAQLEAEFERTLRLPENAYINGNALEALLQVREEQAQQEQAQKAPE